MTRWPTNLWNVSIKRKSNSRRIVISATFSTYVEMSQRILSINGNVERFLGVSYVQSIDATKESPRRYCVEIGMQVEASWPIAIVSHRFSIHLNRFVCRMLDPPSRRTNLDPCFLFFLTFFCSFFIPFESSESFLTRMTFRPGPVNPDGPPMLLDPPNWFQRITYARNKKKIQCFLWFIDQTL